MEKSVTVSKQVLKFTFIELKASGQTLAGEMARRRGGLNFILNNYSIYGKKKPQIPKGI